MDVVGYLSKLTLRFINILIREHDLDKEPDHLSEWNDLFTNFNTAYLRDVFYTVYECEKKYKLPRRSKPWLDAKQPLQSKPKVYALHKCPSCGSNKVILMIYGEETVWKCATEGCVVPARQFITVADEMGK